MRFGPRPTLPASPSYIHAERSSSPHSPQHIQCIPAPCRCSSSNAVRPLSHAGSGNSLNKSYEESHRQAIIVHGLEVDYSHAVYLPSWKSRASTRAGACPLQWLPLLLAFHSPHDDTSTSSFDGDIEALGIRASPVSAMFGTGAGGMRALSGGMRALSVSGDLEGTSTGPCVLDLTTSCVCSSNFAAAGACAATSTTNGFQYSSNERCQVTFAQHVLLQVHLFDTESCCDKLTVDPSAAGIDYSGTDGPDGVASALSWSSDGSDVRDGFKICFTAPSPYDPYYRPYDPYYGGGPPPPPTYAISSDELITALRDNTVGRIMLRAGTYELYMSYSSGCYSGKWLSESALCINRAVTIEAEVPGSVVLDAMGRCQVFNIKSSGTVDLIGLNITGGSALVRRVLVRTFCAISSIDPLVC